jgi:hypothetical protein
MCKLPLESIEMEHLDHVKQSIDFTQLKSNDPRFFSTLLGWH